MIIPTERRRSGLDYLAAVTALLDRIRTTDPRSGLYEAAEPQWWWGQIPRRTDDFDQLFWFDAQGRPEAAVVATAWGDDTQLHPLVLPDASSDWISHVMRRGLDHAADAGFESVMIEVDQVDHVLRNVLTEHGLSVGEGGLVESWMAASERPAISPLHDGYQLFDRSATMDRPHHMINERRGHIDPEPRLNQTSLYRPEHDLVVYSDSGDVAAYSLFWYNPVTDVGVVEPMRTEDDHQQRGLARHLLTSGIERLAAAGAKRIKVCFEPDNPGAQHLYLSTGFKPDRANDLFTGPTRP